ncbi:hypothetical protein KY290_001708 [Solanum tuberosum]|uniref:Secreted protein n=1 Tax=Solanum tuberosum TaxID=4113 RepID=A0ABQ7WN24_SOLTU|nr:hypothetical protein KY284_001746 [Solanum tuberosum]KAH0782110.1 hypothetical protein KY290_001708 [Solanum tuberosum]
MLLASLTAVTTIRSAWSSALPPFVDDDTNSSRLNCSILPPDPPFRDLFAGCCSI